MRSAGELSVACPWYPWVGQVATNEATLLRNVMTSNHVNGHSFSVFTLEKQ